MFYTILSYTQNNWFDGKVRIVVVVVGAVDAVQYILGIILLLLRYKTLWFHSFHPSKHKSQEKTQKSKGK